MRRSTRLAAALATVAAACGPSDGNRLYTSNDLVLVTAYTAKDTCSCLFVMNQTQDYCLAWTQASPAVAHWTADMNAKVVEASAALFWSARAHYVDDQLGCVLE